MGGTGSFQSVLFWHDTPLQRINDATEPDCFHDLNLDQVVREFCTGHAMARLEPFFWTTLPDTESVRYRQQAMQEIGRPDVIAAMRRFADGIALMRQHQALQQQVGFVLQRQRCLLDAAATYCAATQRLMHDLAEVELRSPALSGMTEYLCAYVASAEFTCLESDVTRTLAALDSITYLLHIRANRITVRKYNGQPDLGHAVALLFARFRDSGSPDDPVLYRDSHGFSRIDAAVLAKVADLFPREFGLLTTFAEGHSAYVNTVVARLGRELEFVLACLEFKDRILAQGLPMCYPDLVDDHSVLAENCYDLALAATEPRGDQPIVRNTLRMAEPERFVVITGPNQGGKTTLARAFGQLHYLAALGCPVPAAGAHIPLIDHVYTHFERQEDPGSQRGKLQDDLIRVRAMLQTATEQSLIVLNEVFSSTSTDDALLLAERTLDRMLAKGCVGVCVTFLDELASYDERIASMVAEVDPADPSVRTYRITRRPADGRAFATSIARKYRLARGDIKKRVLR